MMGRRVYGVPVRNWMLLVLILAVLLATGFVSLWEVRR